MRKKKEFEEKVLNSILHNLIFINENKHLEKCNMFRDHNLIDSKEKKLSE